MASAVFGPLADSGQRAPLFGNLHELRETQQDVRHIGGGLLQIKIAGLERCLFEEMERKLMPLLNQRVSILRVGDCWGAQPLEVL